MNPDEQKMRVMETRGVILREAADFPALPPMCRTLLTQLSNPNADFASVAQTLQYDPGMTANVLKLANSAYFGASRQITSLQVAFVRVGMKKLFQLAVASGMAPRLGHAMDGYDLGHRDLLRHSIWTAVAAEEIAKEMGIHAPDMLFTAGLLHDVGKVVLNRHLGEVLNQVTDRTANSVVSFDRAEVEFLGISHAETGAMMLDGWHFPKELVSAVRWHHEPDAAPQHGMVVCMVHIADVLSYTEGIGTGVDGLRYAISDAAIRMLGIRTRQLERVAGETLSKMQELERLLVNE